MRCLIKGDQSEGCHSRNMDKIYFQMNRNALAAADKRSSPLSMEEELEWVDFALPWTTHYEDTDCPAQGWKYSTWRLAVFQPYT